MIKGDSPLQTLADLRRHKVAGPAEDSITSVMMRASLRDARGNDLPKSIDVRYQNAVPFMIENNLAAAGVSASKAIVKKWQDQGGRVLFTSKPVPIKQLLASRRVPAEQRAEQTRHFVTLERTETGRNRLKSLHVPDFVESSHRELMPIGDWLGSSAPRTSPQLGLREASVLTRPDHRAERLIAQDLQQQRMRHAAIDDVN